MSTVVVSLSDKNYESKMTKTIQEIRSIGEWHGDLVLITVGFNINPDFRDLYKIQEVQFPKIQTDGLVEKIKRHPFTNSDKREYNKLTQWEKLHVFDQFFQKWERVVFIDAGTRIFDSIQPFLDLEWRGKFLSHDDETHKSVKNGFLKNGQLETISNPESLRQIKEEFGSLLDKTYFLNSIWIYDTSLLNVFSKEEMIEYMNKYPISRTNEMTIMNLVINIKYGLWTPFPQKTPSGKFLYEWCEWNQVVNGHPLNWRNFCMMKYPVTCSI